MERKAFPFKNYIYCFYNLKCKGSRLGYTSGIQIPNACPFVFKTPNQLSTVSTKKLTNEMYVRCSVKYIDEVP